MTNEAALDDASRGFDGLNPGDRVHNKRTNEYARVLGLSLTDRTRVWVVYDGDRKQCLVPISTIDRAEQGQ